MPLDPRFTVALISQTPNPQQVIYGALHQDYAEDFVWDERDRWPTEEKCGDIIVKQLLAGGRGHFGPLEHPQIVLNCGWFPHSTMQQLRTHRISVSFDVQSFRYTGQRIVDVFEGSRDVDEVFYLRPVGEYVDRQGQKYIYSDQHKASDRSLILTNCAHYAHRIHQGFSEEHARGLIPFDVRQHWVMSANVRSLMHILDMRWKADAQLEAQQLCDLIWPHFEAWVPAIAEWYMKNRAHKARLSP